MKSSKPPMLLAVALVSMLLVSFYAVYQPPVNNTTLTLTGQSQLITTPPAANLQPKTTTVSREPATPADTGVSVSAPALDVIFSANDEPATAPAEAVVITDPALQSLVDQVEDGRAGVVRGVYVKGVLSLPVLQQPEKDAAYVSSELGTVTEFQSATRNGITGLLAHNYLSGILFYNIQMGQEVSVVYGDGAVRQYRVDGIYAYQKLNPSNLRSELIDLRTGAQVSTDEVFSKFYRGEHRVTFQTCLERNGLSNWGLTFITATLLGE